MINNEPGIYEKISIVQGILFDLDIQIDKLLDERAETLTEYEDLITELQQMHDPGRKNK
jgi:hypothetical protein